MKLTIDISPQEVKELTGMDKMEEIQRELIQKIIQQYRPYYDPRFTPNPTMPGWRGYEWTCGEHGEYWNNVTAMFDPTKWPLYKTDEDKH